MSDSTDVAKLGVDLSFLVAGEVPGLGLAVGVAGLLVDTFWPGGTDDGYQRQMQAEIEAQVSAAIANYDVATQQKLLSGKKSVFEEIRTDFEEIKRDFEDRGDDPPVESLEHLYDRIVGLRDDFTQDGPSFTESSAPQRTLPYLIQFATLHLAVVAWQQVLAGRLSAKSKDKESKRMYESEKEKAKRAYDKYSREYQSAVEEGVYKAVDWRVKQVAPLTQECTGAVFCWKDGEQVLNDDHAPAIDDLSGDLNERLEILRQSAERARIDYMWKLQTEQFQFWKENALDIARGWNVKDMPNLSIWYQTGGRWVSADGDAHQWGTSGDLPVPADYDGDGRAEVAVWRPSDGFWYIKDGFFFEGRDRLIQWGQDGDFPVPADYNGDGRAEIAVWRPSGGHWFFRDGYRGDTQIIQWGTVGDIPVPADYNGDGKAEIVVWRPSDGNWYFRDGYRGDTKVIQWGQRGDVPVPADYNGDGKAEIVVWRPSDGTWYFRDGQKIVQLGQAGDIPVPADFHDDGKAEIVVWRRWEVKWHFKDGYGLKDQEGEAAEKLRGGFSWPREGVPIPSRITSPSRGKNSPILLLLAEPPPDPRNPMTPPTWPVALGSVPSNPLPISRASGLVLYSNATGYRYLGGIDDNGFLSVSPPRNWHTGWTHIVHGNFGGNTGTDLLLYNKGVGTGTFYTLDRGRRSILNNYPGEWDKTWDQIIPGNFGRSAYTDLLFYDRTAGSGKFYTVDQGYLNPLTSDPGWYTGWKFIVPGNFGGSGQTDLLFYDPANRNGVFYTTEQGHLTLLNSYPGQWHPGWTHIVPGNFGGNGQTDLLFYDATMGTGEFYATDQGHLIPMTKYPGQWRKTWTHIVPVAIGRSGQTGLLFYEGATGNLEIYPVSGGALQAMVGQATIEPNLSQIVAEPF